MNQAVMQRPPSREVYFCLLRPHFLDDGLEKIQAAYEFSKYGHYKQKRDSGVRYFDHPKAVSLIVFQEWRVFNWRCMVGALLHDIREDSFILSEKRIRINFGKKSAYDVKLLTKEDAEYFSRLLKSGNWRAMLIKIADRIHNLRTLECRPREKQKEQVEETRAHFFDLCDALEEVIPRKYRHVIPMARSELRTLCKKYD
mgnify:FL=1